MLCQRQDTLPAGGHRLLSPKLVLKRQPQTSTVWNKTHWIFSNLGLYDKMASNNEWSDYKLSQDQIDHFMRHGYVRLTNCFSRAKAAEWTAGVWTRLGYSPTDKSTWTTERINMPQHKSEPVQTFAPKAWAAICELLGGEDRVAAQSANWSDGLIVNLGTQESEGKWPHPAELPGWHVDGDFFMHFLDSPEQGLLVIPLFTDIVEHAGGTMICSDAIKKIAQHLVGSPGLAFLFDPCASSNLIWR